MLTTYLNDNQNMAYPFFGDVELPFAMSCITGLGLCIELEDDQDTSNSFFASDVVITEKAVWISICKRSGGATGVIGLMYANTDGYYTYIPSWVLDAVYEDQTIIPLELRYVYAAWNEEFDPETVGLLASDMQVFYTYVRDGSGITAERRRGCGYMTLGIIPQNSIGIYRGEFYIDPSCITFMPRSVYGKYTDIKANNTQRVANQLITLEAAGLLSFAIEGNTVSFVNTAPNDSGYITLPEDNRQHVTMINGGTIEATESNPYPALIIDTDVDGVFFDVLDRDDISTITITVHGDHTFPNCYLEGDEA